MIEGDVTRLRATFARGSLVHLANSGSTSWHGFARQIVDGLRGRQVPLKVGEVVPISTSDFPTKAVRPANSRLDLARLKERFGVTTPSWQDALDIELEHFVKAEKLASN